MVRKIGERKRAPYGLATRFVQLACAAIACAAAPAATMTPPPIRSTPTQPGRDVRILALGDSLTAGFGLPRRHGFAPQLEAYLRRQGIRAHVVNAGVSGDTAAQGLERLDWTLASQSPKPDLAIVELGANDMLRGLSPIATRNALNEIMLGLQRRNIGILLAGFVAAPNLGPDYAVAFNAIYPDLARRYGAMLHPFFLEGVAGRAELNQPDGLHPTLQGVKVIVLGIAPKVMAAMGV